MRFMVFLIGILLSNAALAQQQSDPVNAAIVLSLDLQKRAVAAQDLAAAFMQQRERIAQLEKICGDPCKIPPSGEKQ
jgi:hypothetical protein